MKDDKDKDEKHRANTKTMGAARGCGPTGAGGRELRRRRARTRGGRKRHRYRSRSGNGGNERSGSVQFGLWRRRTYPGTIYVRRGRHLAASGVGRCAGRHGYFRPDHGRSGCACGNVGSLGAFQPSGGSRSAPGERLGRGRNAGKEQLGSDRLRRAMPAQRRTPLHL